jgi:Ni/Co efflux regulator RcnB
MIQTRTNTRLGYVALALGLLVAAALAVMVIASPVAQSATPAKTNLTIKAEGTDLSGKVSSQRQSCVRDRTVKVYKVKPGKDQYIAQDTSDSQGRWNTGNTGMRGKFYARTAAISGCTGAVSNTVRAN